MGGRGAEILARIESVRRSRRASGFVVWDRSDRKPVPVARIFPFGRCEKCEFRTRNLLFCEKKITFIVNLTG